jgi:1,4-alpha-glucan branching enzyme
MATQVPINPEAVPMGGNIVPNRSGATFRCWAPRAINVQIHGSFNDWGDDDDGQLHRRADFWSGFVPGAKEGDTYKFHVEGTGTTGYKRDPYARELTRSWPTPDCVLRDPRSYNWHDDDQFRPPPFNDLITYQLHVGVFNGPDRQNRAATFLDLLGKLAYLRALGINSVLFLPIVEFDNPRSLGYEGADIFSPEMDYCVPPGEIDTYLPLVNGLRNDVGLPPLTRDDLIPHPNQLKAVIHLFHRFGLAVLLDVVYNHASDKIEGRDESFWFFDRVAGTNANDSLYFTDQKHTGPVFAFWKQEVRGFLIDNARFFLEEYRFDGFRYDQASVIVQQNSNDGWGFCQAVTGAARFVRPSAINIAEYWGVDPYVVRFPEHGGAGFDATWHDGLRRSIREAIGAASAGAGSQVNMGRIAENLWTPNFLNAWRAVQYVESHDEVYRGRGQRLPQLADGSNSRSWYARSRSRVAAALLLTAPGIPMIFMGQSFLEDKQWADDATNHPNLLLWWEGLDFGRDPNMGRFHRFMEELCWLRRSEPALRSETLNTLHARDDTRVLAFHRWLPGEGRDVVVVASLNDTTLGGYELGWPAAGRWREIFNSDAYDDYPPNGNGGGIDAWWAGRDNMPATARLTIPSNSVLVFAR